MTAPAAHSGRGNSVRFGKILSAFVRGDIAHMEVLEAALAFERIYRISRKGIFRAPVRNHAPDSGFVAA